MADEVTTPKDEEAQTGAPPEDSSEVAAPPDETQADEAFALRGHKLDEMSGSQVGKIEGEVAGQVRWLIARMGRFGHYCLVPGRDAVAANGRVWVPYTRDQIRRAPRVEPDDPLDAELEQAVIAHYGLS